MQSIHKESPYHVRLATRGDEHGIARVIVDTWRDAYKAVLPTGVLDALDYTDREHAWAGHIDDAAIGSGAIFVAERHPEGIIAFACCAFDGFPGFSAELHGLYVLPSYQDQGIGKRLVRSIAEWLLARKASSMAVRVIDGTRACGFYEQIGGEFSRLTNKVTGNLVARTRVYGWTDLPNLIATLPEA